MRRTVPFLIVGPLLGAFAVGGCDNNMEARGFAAPPGSVEKLEINAQSREDVVRLIGNPSAIATFNPNIWYFISQKQEQFAFLKPQVREQSVLQLTFNESGRLQAIKNYEMKDGQDVAMVARITPTAGKELTVLEQLLGNIGRFSGPRQDGNPGAPTGAGN